MLTAELVRERALEMGFDLVGFAPVGPAPGAEQFMRWLSAGYHGQMAYLARAPERRLDPRQVLPPARTVVIVGISYETLAVPMALLTDPARLRRVVGQRVARLRGYRPGAGARLGRALRLGLHRQKHLLDPPQARELPLPGRCVHQRSVG
jgi:epoxyqueuosine reductase QueG